MRQVLALFVAVVFTMGLATAALAQTTTTTPGSSSSQTAPAPSGTAPTPPPTTDASKPSTDPSKSATDPTKPSTDTSKGAAGAGKTGQDKAMGPDKAKTAAGSMRGQHRMMGEVTKIDSAKGAVTLKTDEGEMDLHFPPSALQGIKEGDKVEVQLAIRPAAGGAASKDMGKTGAAPKAGKSTSSTDTGAKPKTTP